MHFACQINNEEFVTLSRNDWEIFHPSILKKKLHEVKIVWQIF